MLFKGLANLVGHAPKLTLDYFTEKFNYINTDEYANFLHGINKNNNDNISEVIKANNYDKIHKWSILLFGQSSNL